MEKNSIVAAVVAGVFVLIAAVITNSIFNYFKADEFRELNEEVTKCRALTNTNDNTTKQDLTVQQIPAEKQKPATQPVSAKKHKPAIIPKTEPDDLYTYNPSETKDGACYYIVSSSVNGKYKQCKVCINSEYCPRETPFKFGRCVRVIDYRADSENRPYWKYVSSDGNIDSEMIPLGFCFNWQKVK